MDVYKSKFYICKNCSTKFKIEVETSQDNFNNYRLDFKPIGHERLIYNFIKFILSFDEYCTHNIIESNFINDCDVIGFDVYLENKAKEFLNSNSEVFKYKQASLLYLFASWFNNETIESNRFLEEASDNNLQYIMLLNKVSSKQDVLYDLVFLDVHRRLALYNDYSNSIARLIKHNIFDENNVNNNFNEYDIDNILKITNTQISLLSNGNSNVLTLQDIDVNYLDCFLFISNFLMDKDTFSKV